MASPAAYAMALAWPMAWSVAYTLQLWPMAYGLQPWPMTHSLGLWPAGMACGLQPRPVACRHGLWPAAMAYDLQPMACGLWLRPMACSNGLQLNSRGLQQWAAAGNHSDGGMGPNVTAGLADQQGHRIHAIGKRLGVPSFLLLVMIGPGTWAMTA